MKVPLVIGLAGLFLGFGAIVLGARGTAPPPAQSAGEHSAFLPGLTFNPSPTPTATPPPTPTPLPPEVPTTIYLASGGITMSPQVEPRHTIFVRGQQQLDTPSHPSRVAWYDRFGYLGRGGSNTLMSAHINYVGYGNGPFARLTSARQLDILEVRTASGKTLKYSVLSVQVVHLSTIDMDTVVYPNIADNRERVTLISCGGTFVPNASGVGGHYDSRVILVAERYVD